MIDNYKDFQKMLNFLPNRPKLLLHACCAPCSSHVLFLLNKYFDITIFFSNDNIYPFSEYQIRLEEITRFASELEFKVQVLADPFKEEDYDKAVKGFENLGEKSHRCYECYKLRLEKTALKALKLGYDFFSTTLSISPYKLSSWINEIGYALEAKYQVKFLYSDFKKEEGYRHSIELSNKYHLYRQNYCGCKYSYNERRESLDRITKENKS